ncbi:MAG TPA: cellulase family glycosylhydrolase [Bacteroidales bacterium]|nr:cellulase family glycosylhydrolase [Bacteroidales bacterium]
MDTNKLNRRDFIRSGLMAGAAVGLGGTAFPMGVKAPSINVIPRWRGFNLLDYFSPSAPGDDDKSKTSDDDFLWMADWGFDFVRIPMAYPRYIEFDRSKNITRDDFYKFNSKVLDEIDSLVYNAIRHGLHVSLNLHRAPGYCINAGFYEPYNLWKDKEAQDAFYYHWRMWAERYKGVPKEKISFDLLNEPAYREDLNDQFSKNSAVPGELYRKIAMETSRTILEYNPERIIIADGNNVGNSVVPEIADLNIAQSCRGYFPHYISHYQAPWVFKDPSSAPVPVWPGMIDGKQFGKESLEAYYKPWIELKDKGVGVHCGECGCWKNTPHQVFLEWFRDLLQILTRHEIGYALWNFRGDFGILDSGRKDVLYEDWYGHQLDRKLLDLLKRN